jgi:hypothetical protein
VQYVASIPTVIGESVALAGTVASDIAITEKARKLHPKDLLAEKN